MDDLAIRRARLDDLPTIVRHNLAMAQETEGKALDIQTVQRGTRGVLEDERRGFYLLAERAGRVVGQLMVTREWSDWRDADFWWIQSVYVLPEARRSGVFRSLYRHLLSLARKADEVCSLRLYTLSSNQPAQATYRSLGMRRTAYDVFEAEIEY